MNNLSNSIKKFTGNKNTITIIGVVLCIIILYVGYTTRINQQVKLTKVPYANQTIQPKKEITAEMISYMNVPEAFLTGSYYNDAKQIIGKYSNYNTMIAEGSIFYTDLVVDSSVLPDSAFINIEKGYTPINYKVNMDTTYANSMMPDTLINIYFKAKNDEGKLMFGKFISNIKILDVKDSSGQKVFQNTEEARVPAYMLFALPEDMHLLFRKALYLSNTYSVEIILVPHAQEVTEKDAVMVSSEDIKNFINERTEMVSVDEILSETADKVGDNKETNNN